MSEPETRWYVVHTRPHAERKAAEHLQRQGFTTYLPLYLKRRRHARRVETVASPLFPRYLFVAMDLGAQRWRAVQSTIGVSQLVCNGDEPAAIGDTIIAAFREQEHDGYVRLPPPPCFARGAAIRVTDGAFASCLGLFEGMKDEERVTILLDLLGRKVRVVLERESVIAA